MTAGRPEVVLTEFHLSVERPWLDGVVWARVVGS